MLFWSLCSFLLNNNQSIDRICPCTVEQEEGIALSKILSTRVFAWPKLDGAKEISIPPTCSQKSFSPKRCLHLFPKIICIISYTFLVPYILIFWINATICELCKQYCICGYEHMRYSKSWSWASRSYTKLIWLKLDIIIKKILTMPSDPRRCIILFFFIFRSSFDHFIGF
jgi:hypothetical protein